MISQFKVRRREQQFLAVPLLLGSLSGFAGLVYLFLIPSDPGNSILFGFSLFRLLEGLVLLVGSLVMTVLLVAELKEPDLATRLTELSGWNKPKPWSLLASWIALLFVVLVFFPGKDLFMNQIQIIERLSPILIWMAIFSFVYLCVLLWWKRTEGFFPNFRFLTKIGIVVVIIAILVFFFALPATIGLVFKKGSLLFLLLVSPTLYLTYKRLDLFGYLSTFLLLTLILGGALVGVWANGITDLNMVGGLLPFNDANGYYHGGRLLTQGELFHSFSAKRPLFPAFLGALLWLSGDNLRTVLGLLVLTVLLSIYLASHEVNKKAGPIAAVFLALGSFLFIRRFIGSTMSEILGFPLGLGGFALFWSGASKKRFFDVLVGTLMLSLGLLSRAGPFFMIPMLVLWAGWVFGTDKQKFGWKFAGAIVLSFAIAYGINFGIYSTLAGNDSSSMSNFSYTLYGLVTGGTGWKRYAIDHPELLGMSEPGLSQTIYQYAWEAIKTKPINTLIGAVKYWRAFFSLEWSGLFGFVEGATQIESVAGRVLMSIFTSTGLILAIRKFSKPENSMVIAGVVGILLSVPFLPTIDAEIRTYAAGIPWFIAPAIVVLKELNQKLLSDHTRQAGEIQQKGTPFGLLFFSAGMVCLMFPGPLMLRAWIKPVDLQKTSQCSTGQASSITQVTRGSYVNIYSDSDLRSSMVPDLRHSDFSKSLHDAPMYDLAVELLIIKPGHSFFTGYDRFDKKFENIVIPTSLLQEKEGWLELCGTQIKKSSGFTMLEVESVRKLVP